MKTAVWAALGAAAAMACGPVRAAEPVQILMTSMAPGKSGFSSRFFNPWAKEIMKDAHGTLKVEVRDGYALASFRNVYDRVLSDIVQVGWGMQGLIGGKFPLTEVAGIPFEADNATEASVALWRLYAKGGPLAAEYKGLHPLALGTYPMNGVHYAKKPATLDNFDGLKLRAASKTQGEWISHLGGAPISMDARDIYSALQRGTIDATLQAWSAFGPLHFAEVTFYHLDIGFGTSTIMLFMSQKKYDALPAAGRKAIDAHSGESRSRAWGQFLDKTAAATRKHVLGMKGHVRLTLTPAQLASWRKRIAPVTEEWENANPGAKALLAAYRAEVAKVKAGK